MNLGSDGFFISAEILALAVKNKLRILEIPVTHRPRLGGNSKVNAWSIFGTIKEYAVDIYELTLKSLILSFLRKQESSLSSDNILPGSAIGG